MRSLNLWVLVRCFPVSWTSHNKEGSESLPFLALHALCPWMWGFRGRKGKSELWLLCVPIWAAAFTLQHSCRMLPYYLNTFLHTSRWGVIPHVWHKYCGNLWDRVPVMGIPSLTALMIFQLFLLLQKYLCLSSCSPFLLFIKCILSQILLFVLRLHTVKSASFFLSPSWLTWQ